MCLFVTHRIRQPLLTFLSVLVPEDFCMNLRIMANFIREHEMRGKVDCS